VLYRTTELKDNNTMHRCTSQNIHNVFTITLDQFDLSYLYLLTLEWLLKLANKHP